MKPETPEDIDKMAIERDRRWKGVDRRRRKRERRWRREEFISRMRERIFFWKISN